MSVIVVLFLLTFVDKIMNKNNKFFTDHKDQENITKVISS